MATRRWLGGAQSIPQGALLTYTSVSSGATSTVTINGKSVSGTGSTGNDLAASIAANCSASLEPEFAELTFVADTDTVLITAQNARPFTVTATAASATVTNVAAPAGTGPNYWDEAKNWSGGAVPVTGDDVVFDGSSSVDCLYGLAQSGVTLASLVATAGYTGQIGLPARNEAGYAEYRDQYLAIGATVVTVGQGSGSGSPRIRLNTGSVACTLNVYSSAAPAGTDPAAIQWKGTSSSNVLNRYGGSVGVALFPGETATVATSRIVDGGGNAGAAVAVQFGSGCTLTTISQSGGEIVSASGCTTLNVLGGEATLQGSASVSGTTTLAGGTLFLQTAGSLGAVTVRAGGVLNIRSDLRPHTVGTVTVHSGGTVYDTYGTIPTSTDFVLPEGIEGVTLELGKGITVRRSA